MFGQLHVHSTYSMLDGLGSMKSLVSHAQSLGIETLALTDYFGVYGAIDFYQQATAAGIKPLFGMEVGYVDDVSTTLGATQVGTLCLLAKNYQGYKSLLSLASLAHTHLIAETPTIDAAMLQPHTNSLLAYVGSPSSVLGRMVEQGVRLTDIVTTLENMGFASGDLYIEMVAQLYTNYPVLKKIAELVGDLCQLYAGEIDCFVASPVHYIQPEDKQAFELAMAIKDGNKMYDKNRRRVKGDLHMMSRSTMQDIYKSNGVSSDDIIHRYTTTSSLIDRCSVSLDLYQSLFPEYQTPPHLKKLYNDHQDTLIDVQ